MFRLTISLEDAMHQALKKAETRQGRSTGEIIEESLIPRGIKAVPKTSDLIAKARWKSTITGTIRISDFWGSSYPTE